MSEMPFLSKPTAPAKDNHRKIKIWMFATQLIAVLILILWIVLLLFAAMIGWPAAIEAEGGWDFLAVTFSLLLFYPLFAITAVVCSWILYAKRQYRMAEIVTSFPMLVFILGILLWVFVGWLDS